MKLLIELRGPIVNPYTIGMPQFEERVLNATKQCCKILDFDNVCDIYYKESDIYYLDQEERRYCDFYWRFFRWFKFRPVIVLTEDALETNYDTLGITILHQLLRAKRGYWKMVGENIINTVKFGIPPTISSAWYFSTSLWWDQKEQIAK